MSAHRSCFVYCDGKDCDDHEPYDESCQSVGEARDIARAEGWRVSLPGGRDLCPDCKSKS